MTRIEINPGAVESCDGVDNDYDLEVDEDLGSLWYLDQDGDGYGDPASSVLACEQPQDYVAKLLDCDAIDGELFPGATESCDGYDNDCDGLTDEADSSDALTWFLMPMAMASVIEQLTARMHTSLIPPATPMCSVTRTAMTPTGKINAVELCRGENDDCDNDIDESAVDALTWYRDSDGDSLGMGPFDRLLAHQSIHKVAISLWTTLRTAMMVTPTRTRCHRSTRGRC